MKRSNGKSTRAKPRALVRAQQRARSGAKVRQRPAADLAHQPLQDSEALALFRALDVPITLHDGPTGRVTALNEAAWKLFGLPLSKERQPLGGLKGFGHANAHLDRVHDSLLRCLQKAAMHSPGTFECSFPHASGALLKTEVTLARVRLHRKNFTLAVIRPLSRSSALEKQVRDAEKMEALGQLAGGIAHDFNNLLQVIKGYAEMLLQDLQMPGPANHGLSQIVKASNRAADLVRQLLVFSRREGFQPIDLDLNELVTQLSQMFRRIIGDTVELDLQLATNLPAVPADPGQIEQVLTNLCVNARDAMPQGGQVLIRTSSVQWSETDILHRPWAKPGYFVELSVTDTGTGLTPEVRQHLFEPFFTTKEVGKGTGLGLAAVYGVIQKHEGLIDVVSEPGQGASFRLYFPIRPPTPPSAPASPARQSLLPSTRPSVLLAEDEPLVRAWVLQLLTDQGLQVLEARDGQEAIDLLQNHAASLSLAILDVVMPKRSGREVLEAIRAQRQDLPVLFCTGYGRDEIGPDYEPGHGVELLMKPYSPAALLDRVRQILRH